MTVISADTSVLDVLNSGASATYFGLLHDSNDLTEEQINRQKKVEDELSSMVGEAEEFYQDIKSNISNNVSNLKAGIVNPLTKMREDSITAYTSFTESVDGLGNRISDNLSDVKTNVVGGVLNLKDSFSSKVDSLKVGLTDVVASTGKTLDDMSIKMEAFSNLPTEKQLLLAGSVIADSVINTVSSIPDVISVGMEKLDKGISSVSGFVKSSSTYLKGLFQKSEDKEDVGGTSGIADTSKPTEADTGSLGGIGAFIGKLVPKKLLGVFSKTGKALGKVGKFAGKIAAPLAIIMGIFDFIGGVKDAADIVGKPKEQLSTLEKAGAGLSSVLSGLTFGLISAKSIYSEGSQVISSISDFTSNLYNKLPDGVKQYTDKIGDFLFSSDGGVFSIISSLFTEVITDIENGDWTKLLYDAATAPFRSLFSKDGIISNAVSGAFSLLPDSFQTSINGFIDTIMGYFESIKKMASDLIPDSLKKLVGNVADSSVGSFVGDTVDVAKNLLGFGSVSDVEPKKVIKKVDKVQAKAPAKTVTSVVEQVSKPVKTVNKKEVTNTVFETRKEIRNSDTATKKSKQLINKKNEPPVIINNTAPSKSTPAPSRQLNTSTSIGDTELAVMNSNIMD